MWADFHFLRPAWLSLLPVLFALAWYALRPAAATSAWRRVVDAHLLSRLLEAGGRASRLPLVLLLAGGSLLVLALAGPTWQRLPQPVYQAPYFRVVVLDLSLSMNAADLKPSRLAQARFKVIDLVQQVADGQTALIAYGAEPFVVSPLTGDAATIVAQVPLLSTDLLPVNGPSRADLALRAAADLLRQAGAGDGEVVLLSDAIREAGRAVSAARALHDAGYRVSVLGVATEQGAPLPLPGGGFVKDPQGEIVVSRLDRESLAAVAAAGGGRFVAASLDNRDLAALAPDRRALAGDAVQQQDAKADQWREEGPWLVLLLLPLAALAFRRGWLGPLVVVVCVLPTPDALALGWDELWLRADQRGMRALDGGDPAQAAEAFERPDWRAAAAYRAGDYARALQSLEAVEGVDNAYNTGNALARLGRLEDAVAAYEKALQADPQDADARHNRDLVKRLLEQQAARQREDEQRADKDQDPQDQQDAAGQQQAQQEQADQGREDEAAGQGETSSEQDQSASDQLADKDGEGRPQPGDKAEGGSSSANTRQSSADEQPSSPGEGAQTAEADQAGSDKRQAPGDGGDVAGAQAGEPAERQDPAGSERQAADGTPGAGGEAVQPQAAGRTGEGAGGSLDSSDAMAQAGDAPSDAGDSTPRPEQVTENASPGVGQDQRLAAGRRPGQADLTGGPPELDDLSQRRSPADGQGKRLAGQSAETEQAMEQMLRRVEDDPGGLLRQRFLLQHLRRNGQLP